jgi:hypothetical protein
MFQILLVQLKITKGNISKHMPRMKKSVIPENGTQTSGAPRCRAPEKENR